MYKKAAQLKLRFPSNRGLLNVEQLFELHLQDLNDTAKMIHKELKLDEEVNFIQKPEPNPEQEALADKLAIVKDVIATKIAKQKELEDTLEKRRLKHKLLDALNRKQDASLESMSEDEIKKQLAEIG